MTSHNKSKQPESSFHFYVVLITFFIPYLNMNIFLDLRASGQCKHAGGLLWYIEQEVRLGNNLTCTFRPQKWHQPLKKQQKRHAPAQLNDIVIKKPTSHKTLPGKEGKKYFWSTFDPQALDGKKPLILTETDLDNLKEVTNGNCGLVLPVRYHNFQPQPDLELFSHEEAVESEQKITYESVSDVLANLDANFEKSTFLEKISITKEQVQHIEIITRNQSNNSLWYKFRQGRISASMFKGAVCKVSDDQKTFNSLKLKTITKKICEPKEFDFKSKATEWGITNEPIGRKMYIQLMKNKHMGLQVNKRGFVISVDYPFIRASPDGIMECRCHDEGLLEIKCPFTYRVLSIKDYTAKTDGCLEIVDNHIQLKRTHSFFFFKYNVKCGSQEKDGVFFLYVQLKAVSVKL